MTFTTPERAVDVPALFPELRAHSATATRLHPRPGSPAVTDSSVGGPLLWPAGEQWPVCTDRDRHYVHRLLTPAMVRRDREIYAAARARSPYTVTDEERAELSGVDFSEPASRVSQDIALVPVAQLRRRDVPDFAGPDGSDLLQILWCPLDHDDEGYNPKVRLFWRDTTTIGPLLADPPEPPVVNEDYLPAPCVVAPEQVVEFQYRDLLPAGLAERVKAWDTGSRYLTELSQAPGWKVGGFASWALTDPYPMLCRECGAAMTLLFTVDSAEHGGAADRWRPVEEPADAPNTPTEVVIGRGYSLYMFRCPASFDHPPATAMQ